MPTDAESRAGWVSSRGPAPGAVPRGAASHDCVLPGGTRGSAHRGIARGRKFTLSIPRAPLQDVPTEVSRTLNFPTCPGPHSWADPSSEFSSHPNEMPTSHPARHSPPRFSPVALLGGFLPGALLEQTRVHNKWGHPGAAGECLQQLGKSGWTHHEIRCLHRSQDQGGGWGWD